MTVTSTTRRAGPYSGNGVTTAFPFTFKVFSTADIALTLTDADGISSALVLDTDYSITLNPDQDTSPGGTITYPLSGTPLATGETLVGVGSLPYDQTTDFPPGGKYRAQTVESAFDRTVQQIQQLAEVAGRSLSLPPSAATADTELPAPVATNVIGWNEDATALVNYAPADLATVVVAGTSYFDVFNGTGAQTQFTLTANPGSVNALDIAVDGVPQKNGIDFTVSGTTLTFTTAPSVGTQNVAVRYVAAVPVGSANAQDVTFAHDAAYPPRSVGKTLRDRGVYVTDAPFSAKGDGVADDTSAIQAAIDFVQGLGGGTVYFPPGKYRLTARIVVKTFVKLQGASWLSNAGNGHWIFSTTLNIDWGAGLNSHAVEMQYSSAMEGFMFFYPGQVDKDMKLNGVVQAAPVEFGFSISTPTSGVGFDNIQLKNISLVNSYRGIRLNNGGRWRVDQIQGDPLLLGFTASDCFDVCYLNGVHFWPFYADFPYAGAGGASALGTWKYSNGTGFSMYRVDGCMTTNIFVYGRLVGWSSDNQLWADITNFLTDTCQYPYKQTSSNKVRITNFEFIGSPNVRPAVWYEDGGRLEMLNGYINDTSSVGFQVGGSSGTVLITNVVFDPKVFPLISTGTGVVVKISNSKYSVPPFGTSNVTVDGERLPDASTAVTLPAPLNTPATTVAGGWQFDLASVTSERLRYDVTSLFQRNSLYVLSFDYELVGATPFWSFEFTVEKDTGADKQVNFAPGYPIVLGTTPAQPTRRVFIPFFANFGFYRQVLRITVNCGVAVPGAGLKVTNIQLSEQTNRLTTDSQVSMMMTQGYNLDAYQMGQTLIAKGKNRIVITQPEPGIGRSTEVPTAGTWAVGDEVWVYSPVPGGPSKYICTTAGTPGTWKAAATLAP